MIPEPVGGAQRGHTVLFEQLDVALRVHLKKLCRMSGRASWPTSAIKNTARSEKRGTHEGFPADSHRRGLPGRTVTNEDLSRMVDTSDEWITTRTGIRTRHWCTADESAATLAIAAAKQALQPQRPCPGRHRVLHLCHPVRPGRHPQCGLSGTGGAGPAGKPARAGRQRGLFRLLYGTAVARAC